MIGVRLTTSIFIAIALLYTSTAFSQEVAGSQDVIRVQESPREYTPMMKDRYEKLLTGKTIKGEYRFLRELTKTYDFSETHNADGTTDYREGQVRSKGIWYVLGTQKICYKYPNDKNMGGNTSCFWVYKSEECYYGYSLRQMTLKGPRNYDNWVARWILSGSGGSCAAATG